jgi:hypothetical protein
MWDTLMTVRRTFADNFLAPLSLAGDLPIGPISLQTLKLILPYFLTTSSTNLSRVSLHAVQPVLPLTSS